MGFAGCDRIRPYTLVLGYQTWLEPQCRGLILSHPGCHFAMFTIICQRLHNNISGGHSCILFICIEPSWMGSRSVYRITPLHFTISDTGTIAYPGTRCTISSTPQCSQSRKERIRISMYMFILYNGFYQPFQRNLIHRRQSHIGVCQIQLSCNHIGNGNAEDVCILGGTHTVG